MPHSENTQNPRPQSQNSHGSESRNPAHQEAPNAEGHA